MSLWECGQTEDMLVRLKIVLAISLETYVSESIPLCATLCVEDVCVVVDDIVDNAFDMMVECLTIECRFLWHIKRKTII